MPSSDDSSHPLFIIKSKSGLLSSSALWSNALLAHENHRIPTEHPIHPFERLGQEIVL